MKEPHKIEDIKGVAAGMYGAGVDTVCQSPLPLMANVSPQDMVNARSIPSQYGSAS